MEVKFKIEYIRRIPTFLNKHVWIIFKELNPVLISFHSMSIKQKKKKTVINYWYLN